jgi:transketolase N-terminal domain/subunit
MNIRHIYLDINSCVNNMIIKVLNRKLHKHEGFLNNVLFYVDLNRDVFTKRGLHVNTCEGNCCKEVVTTINNMLNEKKAGPTIMKWKEEDEKES